MALFHNGDDQSLFLEQPKNEEREDADVKDVIEYLESSDYASMEMYDGEIDFVSKTHGDELAYVIDKLEEENDVKRVWEYSTDGDFTVPIEDDGRCYGVAEFEAPEMNVYVVEAGDESAVVGNQATLRNIERSVLGRYEEGEQIEVAEEEDQSQLSDFEG